MDSWQRFNETSLPEKSFPVIKTWKALQMPTANIQKEYEKTLNKKLGMYHDLFMQS